MSDREKKLIVFFALAGFVILNVLALNFAKSKRQQVNASRVQAEQALRVAEDFQKNSEQVRDQMTWLAEHEPEPKANQDVQTTLQQFVEREAKAAGLTIKPGQKPLPTDTTGHHYHRAKIQIAVTGTEDALYRWFDHINAPDQLRIASQIRMLPNNPDDTKIDCTATIEQWFVPPAL
jgi:type I site-specific restriction endonuclease